MVPALSGPSAGSGDGDGVLSAEGELRDSDDGEAAAPPDTGADRVGVGVQPATTTSTTSLCSIVSER